VAGSNVVSASPAARQLTLRPMVDADVGAVAALEEAIYSQPWSAGVFTDELRQQGRAYVVAVVDRELVGYGGLMVVGDDAHVTTLAVDPAARRHRLGTRLMLTLVERGLALGGRHLTLEVRMSNKSAQRLYSRFGLAPVGVRKDYYRDEDALIMWATDIHEDEYQARLARIRELIDE
jgi:ribosomal-protein-alanine N-acetyltransferase